MKAYFVDAGARTITPIDYSYLGLRQWLPGGIAVARMFDNGDVLYVDDEALLYPAKVAFRVAGCDQPMMSNGVLTGRDADGETLPPDMTPAQLAEHIEWLTVDEAMQWFRSRADRPAASVIFEDGEVNVLRRWGDYLPGMEEKK